MAAGPLGRRCLLMQSNFCARALLSSRNHSRLARPSPKTASLPLATTTGRRWYSLEEPESGYRYAESHEWASTNGSNLTTVGISNYAQEKLGELVFVELPDVGGKLEKGDILGVLESVKAAADIHAPVTGTVAEVNQELADNPSLVNEDPYEQGWLVKLSDVDQSDINNLMSAEDYKKFLSEGGV